MADAGLSVKLAVDANDARAQLTGFTDLYVRSAKQISDVSATEFAKTSAAIDRFAASLSPVEMAAQKVAAGTALLNKGLAEGVISGGRAAQLGEQLAAKWAGAAATFELSGRHAVTLSRALITANWSEAATAVARIGVSATGAGTGMLAFGVGVAGLIALLAAAASRIEQADSETVKLDAGIKLLGGTFGATGAEVQRFATLMAKGSPFSEQQFDKASEGLVRLRGISVDAFQEILGDAQQFAVATGQDLPAAAEQLGRAYTDGYGAVKKLDDAYGFLSVAQREQIRELDAQGQHAAAARVFLDALEGRLKSVADIQTPAAAAVKQLGDAWRSMLDSIGNSGVLEVAADTLKRIASAVDWLSKHRFGHGAGEGWIEPLEPSGAKAPKLTTASDVDALKQDRAETADQIMSETNRLAQLMNANAPQSVLDLQGQALGLLEDRLKALDAQIDQAEERLKRDAGAVASAAAHAAGPSDAQTAWEQRRAAQTLGDARNDQGLKAFNDQLGEEEKRLRAEAASLGLTGAAEERAKLALRETGLELDATTRKHQDRIVALAGEVEAKKKATEAEKQYQEALKSARQTVEQQRQENIGLEGIANASAISPSAEKEARRLADASSAFQEKFAAAAKQDQVSGTDAATAAIEREYAAYLRLLEARDRYDQQTQANDEDRKLAQTLAEKQLELSLMGQNATLRAQELADLRLRNQLIDEGFRGDDLEKEYEARKKIQDVTVATDVAIKQQTDAQKQNAEALKQVADELGSALEKYVNGTGDAHKRMHALEQDLSKDLEQQLVFKPFEAGLQNLLGGGSGAGGANPVNAGAGLSGLLTRALGSPSGGGLLGLIFGSSTSSDMAAAMSSDAAHGWSASTGGSSGGLIGSLFGDISDFVSSIFTGGSSSGGATRTIANATLNIANATINGADSATGAATSAFSAGGGLSGAGDFLDSIFGGGSAPMAFTDPVFGAAITGMAKGGAFDGGIRKFAAGGIVTDPTYFSLGQMGEAGPEGILPLQRMPGGALGVRAMGGGGDTHLYVDARGSDDPAAVERRIHAVVRSYIPGIVTHSSSAAVSASFSMMRQGGRAAKISGKR